MRLNSFAQLKPFKSPVREGSILGQTDQVCTIAFLVVSLFPSMAIAFVSRNLQRAIWIEARVRGLRICFHFRFRRLRRQRRRCGPVCCGLSVSMIVLAVVVAIVAVVIIFAAPFFMNLTLECGTFCERLPLAFFRHSLFAKLVCMFL